MSALGELGVRLLGLLMAGGCLLGMLVGIGLLLRPDYGHTLRRPAKELLLPLARSIRTERFFYRHHRLFGGLVFLASAIFLSRLVGFLGQDLTLAPMAGPGGPVQIWLWESVVVFICLAGLFTLTVGILLLLRPSLLRTFEEWANRRFSTRGLRITLTQWHGALSGWILHHPRVIALFLIIGSLFTLQHFLRYHLTFLLGF
ncbi:MAG: hypothetical protein HQL63_01270 [Magnetococcales bacterium]|nr:hypothetical protein [Magnetococcales bacterium]MBF0321524.1 hypothetical protein [Magnetococcales bacterium]